jgi:two-component system alkaline phosphatase synthesis response regulator PhoP
MSRILIVEDEESILVALEDNLRLEGYEVESAADGTKGLALACEKRHDLILLDIMLPGMNGFDLCRRLRQDGISTPILMLTAKGQEVDKVLGLELGADDYVTKPFSPRELLARVKAILRRTSRVQESREVVRFGDVEVDFGKYEARRAGSPIFLTALEFSLLHFLVRNQDRVVSRDAILDEVWGKEIYVQPRTVDKHVAELRKKIGDDPTAPKHIIGVRSVGYKFVA